jgi:GTP-binding protein Era
VRSGFVAVVGRPNVGKSTLTNTMVGTKVAITSRRPQTTRHNIRGVVHRPGAQLVLVDTPGLHKPRTALGHRLNELVSGSLDDADVVVVVIDATADIGAGDDLVMDRAQAGPSPVVLALNKVDRASPAMVAAKLQALAHRDFTAYVPVSARTGEGVDTLLDEVEALLPEGPPYFPREMVTDQPESALVAEIVREKFLARLRDELPHSLAAVVTTAEVRPDGSRYFHVELKVERSSQRGIVIGDAGSMLQVAGTEARIELEERLGTKVFLDLAVGVERDWQKHDDLLDRLGF